MATPPLIQMERDRGECQVWATRNTGVDPVALAQKPESPRQQPARGERARGAVRGAIGGAAIGSIAGDTSKGAAVGATDLEPRLRRMHGKPRLHG